MRAMSHVPKCVSDDREHAHETRCAERIVMGTGSGVVRARALCAYWHRTTAVMCPYLVDDSGNVSDRGGQMYKPPLTKPHL